jgi:phosphatidylserine/phosphatidylglycerophosphate/cardiolipin synthase-like enzyme
MRKNARFFVCVQNCTVGATAESGPREPWQDIHARVEGPAAVDIHDNFVGQCTVQSSWGAVPCLAVLRIRDVYPGSRIQLFSIPDPNCLHPGSRIRMKEF